MDIIGKVPNQLADVVSYMISSFKVDSNIDKKTFLAKYTNEANKSNINLYLTKQGSSISCQKADEISLINWNEKGKITKIVKSHIDDLGDQVIDNYVFKNNSIEIEKKYSSLVLNQQINKNIKGSSIVNPLKEQLQRNVVNRCGEILNKDFKKDIDLER